MTTFEKILYFLKGEMTRPGNYGWFHLLFVGIIAAITIVLCLKFKNCKTKTLNRILLIAWIVLMVGEIAKQILFSFDSDGITASWNYQWYAFPYQLCGTPLVVLPFIIFTKEGKFRDACMAYMATFSLFGGLAVYFYPNDVFVREIAINLQTMIHHGLQVVIGILLAVYNRRKLTFKYYLSSVYVFVVLSAIAIVMNVGVYHLFQAKGIGDTFNMFYISPYFPCTLPVLSAIYPLVPYPVFLAIYVFGFMLISAIIHYSTKAIVSIAIRKPCKLPIVSEVAEEEVTESAENKEKVILERS